MSIEIILGDFREKILDIPDGSVDLVITDPPYLTEHLDLFPDIGEQSARILKDDGSLVIIVAAHLLDKQIAMLSEHLKFYWLFGMGSRSRMRRLFLQRLMSRFKPVLWFVKGKPKNRFMNDFVTPVEWGGTQDDHKWGQPIDWFEYYIKHMTQEGDLVCDPFVGAGSSAIACKRQGRRFIGFEIDPLYHTIAQVNLEGVFRQGLFKEMA